MKEYKLKINSNDYHVVVSGLSNGRADVMVNGQSYSVEIAIQVAVGDRVGTGQRLMILEAMKMENNIDSDREGTVKEIKVATGDSVLEGDVLLTIE